MDSEWWRASERAKQRGVEMVVLQGLQHGVDTLAADDDQLVNFIIESLKKIHDRDDNDEDNLRWV